MNGPGHRLLGMTFALELADLAGWPLPQTAAAAVLAGICAHGRTSPDVDQFPIWRGKTIGRGRYTWRSRGLGSLFPARMRGHRRVTHWWGWPALGALLLACGQVACTALAPAWAPWWWVPGSMLTGWTSHLVGDWWFGRGTGIPLDPAGERMIGLRMLKVGGVVERVVTAVVLPAAMILQAWCITGGHAVDVLHRA